MAAQPKKKDEGLLNRRNFLASSAIGAAGMGSGLLIPSVALAAGSDPGSGGSNANSISVKDFGAVCDGSTDDSGAIQRAIDSFSDYAGGVLVIPSNCAIGKTITITNKKGLIISGQNGQGFPFVGRPFIPTLKWVGAAGGTMIQSINTLELTLRHMSISGNNLAAYGLVLSGVNTGWGVSNYEHLSIFGCTKNALLKNALAAASDFGRNHFKRCTFSCSRPSSGVAVDDACVAYDNDSSVQDVYDHCEFIFKLNGQQVPNSYAVYFKAGTPRVIFRDCYTAACNGVFSYDSPSNDMVATPKLLFARHYSEDLNFVSFSNANTPQYLHECTHALGGGVSIAFAGGAGGGNPLVIDGGYFLGAVNIKNLNTPVILNNSPTFLGGKPSVTEGASMVQIGRSFGNPATTARGAINGTAFVPAVAPTQSTQSIAPFLSVGSVFPVVLVGNSRVAAPINTDQTFDIGREIEFCITGNSSRAYSVKFDKIYKLAGGTYTHSGANSTDVIRFRFNGTIWYEIGRTMNLFNDES